MSYSVPADAWFRSSGDPVSFTRQLARVFIPRDRYESIQFYRGRLGVRLPHRGSWLVGSADRVYRCDNRPVRSAPVLLRRELQVSKPRLR